MRKTRWVPYVGDADMPAAFAKTNVRAFPSIIKPQRCATCGAPDSPFGCRDPSSNNSEYTWYCRQHAGAIMPELPEKLDEQRYDKILTNALLIANLWLAVAMGAKRRNKVDVWTACENIRALNLQTFPLVKELGREKAAEAAKPEVDGDLIP